MKRCESNEDIVNVEEHTRLLEDIKAYIFQNYTRFSFSGNYLDPVPFEERLRQYLVDNPAKESFSDKLNRIISERKLRPSAIYGKLGLDRRHFSKIRTDRLYQPSKRTVLLLALALESDLDETNELLQSAGFALTHANRSDIVVEYFIKNRLYDLMLLNEMLDTLGLPLLLKC